LREGGTVRPRRLSRRAERAIATRWYPPAVRQELTRARRDPVVLPVVRPVAVIVQPGPVPRPGHIARPGSVARPAIPGEPLAGARRRAVAAARSSRWPPAERRTRTGPAAWRPLTVDAIAVRGNVLVAVA